VERKERKGKERKGRKKYGHRIEQNRKESVPLHKKKNNHQRDL
jgi:hypothetical protein